MVDNNYRNKINLNSDTTFGIEIEFVGADLEYLKSVYDYTHSDIPFSKRWSFCCDESLNPFGDSYYTDLYEGGEAVSPILHDNMNTWNDLNDICFLIRKLNGYVNDLCSVHVHVGANIFKDDLKYYVRLAKLWFIYENEITDFCCGEYENIRTFAYLYAGTCANMFSHIDIYDPNSNYNKKYSDFVNTFHTKDVALSFATLSKKYIMGKYNAPFNWEKYKTVEFRLGNPSLNTSVIQNYVNFYTKLMLACLDDTKDWDTIDKKYRAMQTLDMYDLSSMPADRQKLYELSNFIFDNELDKEYFLSQTKINNKLKKVLTK